MNINLINKFSFNEQKSNHPDLVFGVQTGGMGMPGLIMMILNNEVYLFNHQNMCDELYKKYFLLVESYYPELIRVAGYGSEVTKKRNTSIEYNDYYLGMGNHLLVRDEFATKHGINNHDYRSFAKFIEKNITDCSSLYKKSLEMNLPQCLFVAWDKKDDLVDGLQKLKENGFSWLNDDEIDINHDITEKSQHHLCIDYQTKHIGFMPARSLSCGVLYFLINKESFVELVDLHLQFKERKNK